MYPQYPEQTLFQNICEKIIVVTGGASGIGAALVTLLYEQGARVAFGDNNHNAGEVLVKTLTADNCSSGMVSFVSCNVSNYQDVYTLFRKALDLHGRVDHAVSCAGIVDDPKASYFDPDLDVDSVGKSEGN